MKKISANDELSSKLALILIRKADNMAYSL